MSRPPRKAIEQIKRYCEKTQCLRCIYGYKDRTNNIDFVYCTLQERNPCEWDLKADEEVHKPDYRYESDLMKRIDCAWKEPVE